MHAGALGLSALLLAAEQSARECPAAPSGRLPRSPLQPPDPSGRPGTHGPPLPQQAACPGRRSALCARARTVAPRSPSPSPVGPHGFTALYWSLGTCIPAPPSGKASWTQPRGRGPECAVRFPPPPPAGRPGGLGGGGGGRVAQEDCYPWRASGRGQTACWGSASRPSKMGTLFSAFLL